MWRVNYYAMPINDTSFIKPLYIHKYVEMIDLINNNGEDDFYIPKQYFEIQMNNGLTIFEYCFAPNEDEDLQAYLLDHIAKSKTSEEPYTSLIHKCENPTNDTNIALAGIEENKFLKSNPLLYITNDIDIHLIKRFYLGLCRDYNEFIEKIPLTFKNLIFHAKSFDRIRKFDSLESNINEIIRHLCVLNDIAKEMYNQYAESIALKFISSKYNVTCSGKGSNEGEFKLEYLIGETKEQLTCNPHTKLYDGLNDYRIYFSWGRSNIDDGKIVIARMGDHWNS